jgi:hypothetical protein
VADGETELQERIDSFCQVMVQGDKPGNRMFPSSIGEIDFNL